MLNHVSGRREVVVNYWYVESLRCVVYAAQPREGTETFGIGRSKSRYPLLCFMQLNPARGRENMSATLFDAMDYSVYVSYPHLRAEKNT